MLLECALRRNEPDRLIDEVAPRVLIVDSHPLTKRASGRCNRLPDSGVDELCHPVGGDLHDETTECPSRHRDEFAVGADTSKSEHRAFVDAGTDQKLVGNLPECSLIFSHVGARVLLTVLGRGPCREQDGEKAEDDHEYDDGKNYANDDDVAVAVLHARDRIGLCEASDQAST